MNKTPKEILEVLEYLKKRWHSDTELIYLHNNYKMLVEKDLEDSE